MVLSRISNKLNFDVVLNVVLILILIFSKNYLEEDLILGLFSSIILFFIYFFFKESKSQDLRLLRLNIKKIYRVQKRLLAIYYFYYNLLQKRYLKYTKKILKKVFFLKLNKALISMNKKFKNFFSRLIFIKLLTLNILSSVLLKTNIKYLNVF